MYPARSAATRAAEGFRECPCNPEIRGLGARRKATGDQVDGEVQDGVGMLPQLGPPEGQGCRGVPAAGAKRGFAKRCLAASRDQRASPHRALQGHLLMCNGQQEDVRRRIPPTVSV